MLSSFVAVVRLNTPFPPRFLIIQQLARARALHFRNLFHLIGRDHYAIRVKDKETDRMDRSIGNSSREVDAQKEGDRAEEFGGMDGGQVGTALPGGM